MSQKNSVLKKSVATMLSASLATSMAMAATPQSRNSQSESIEKIVICAVKGLLGLSIAGGIATIAWVELFANKTLSVAEELAKELKSDSPNTEKLKKLSMTFAELLHQSTATSETTYSTQGNAFGQSEYNYGDTETCKQDIIDLITETLCAGDEKQNNQDQVKVRVNRLRKVDRKRLQQKLIEMFSGDGQTAVDNKTVQTNVTGNGANPSNQIENSHRSTKENSSTSSSSVESEIEDNENKVPDHPEKNKAEAQVTEQDPEDKKG